MMEEREVADTRMIRVTVDFTDKIAEIKRVVAFLRNEDISSQELLREALDAWLLAHPEVTNMREVVNGRNEKI